MIFEIIDDTKWYFNGENRRFADMNNFSQITDEPRQRFDDGHVRLDAPTKLIIVGMTRRRA